eukprot:10237758-Heterocapsa_arctica.AAC.1
MQQQETHDRTRHQVNCKKQEAQLLKFSKLSLNPKLRGNKPNKCIPTPAPRRNSTPQDSLTSGGPRETPKGSVAVQMDM